MVRRLMLILFGLTVPPMLARLLLDPHLDVIPGLTAAPLPEYRVLEDRGPPSSNPTSPYYKPYPKLSTREIIYLTTPDSPARKEKQYDLLADELERFAMVPTKFLYGIKVVERKDVGRLIEGKSQYVVQ